MANFKVKTKDGKLYISDFHGGFVWGKDSGFVWKSEEEADEAIRHCQPLSDQPLVKEAA